MSDLTYYLPSQIAIHNSELDCWISLYNNVYNLTSLLSSNGDKILNTPIINYAGKDISDWFEYNNNELKLKTCIDPVSGREIYFLPFGRFIHVPSNNPTIENIDYVPWWNDNKYIIGKLSKKYGYVRIINTLTNDNHIYQVAAEEKLYQISKRYSIEINNNAEHYTWKRLGKVLDYKKTLEENDIIIAIDILHQVECNIEDTLYIPAIHLYFNDDV